MKTVINKRIYDIVPERMMVDRLKEIEQEYIKDGFKDVKRGFFNIVTVKFDDIEIQFLPEGEKILEVVYQMS